MIDIRASATITHGVTRNHVRVHARATTSVRLGPERGKRRDGYQVIAISVYRDDLKVIDTAARMRRVSRSELLRQAVRLLLRTT